MIHRDGKLKKDSIYLIMKVGNFIYYNIKELVAIRLILIRNWDYLHTLDDNFLFGFCKNRTLNHKFPTECGRWQNMCTEHGLTHKRVINNYHIWSY
jgi:hypothetical protein